MENTPCSLDDSVVFNSEFTKTAEGCAFISLHVLLLDWAEEQIQTKCESKIFRLVQMVKKLTKETVAK